MRCYKNTYLNQRQQDHNHPFFVIIKFVLELKHLQNIAEKKNDTDIPLFNVTLRNTF